MTIPVSPIEESSVESPAPARPIRVFVIQPQVLMAKALCNALEQHAGIRIVGDACAVDAGQLAKAQPDLILVESDASFEVLSSAIGTCRTAWPKGKIGVLSEHLSSEAMQRALSAGADGYIVTDITPAELVTAVKAMGSGSLYVDPRLVGLILRKHVGIGQRDRNELSPRETDIVRLVANGLTNREISERLGLSDKTVKNHISHIFAKLNVRTRTQVVVHAIRSGLA